MSCSSMAQTLLQQTSFSIYWPIYCLGLWYSTGSFSCPAWAGNSADFPWERRAPARLRKPRWSVALPGTTRRKPKTKWPWPYTPLDVRQDTSVPLAMEALNGLLHPCRAGWKSALWVGADSATHADVYQEHTNPSLVQHTYTAGKRLHMSKNSRGGYKRAEILPIGSSTEISPTQPHIICVE